jgi:hypothetical protein
LIFTGFDKRLNNQYRDKFVLNNISDYVVILEKVDCR